MPREWTRLRVVAVPLLCACFAGCAEDPRGMYRGQTSDGGFVPDVDGGGPDLTVIADLLMNTQGATIKIVEPVMGTLIKTARVSVSADVTRGGG